MIAALRQTTTRTGMPTLRKRFRNSLPADAGLACAAWVNFDKHAPGALSLVRKFIQEAAPSDIVDGLGQHAAGHPLDLEVFHRDHAVVIHQGSGDFVVKVVALILDVGVLTRQNCKRPYAFDGTSCWFSEQPGAAQPAIFAALRGRGEGCRLQIRRSVRRRW